MPGCARQAWGDPRGLVYEEQFGWPGVAWGVLVAAAAIPLAIIVATLLGVPDRPPPSIVPLLGVVALLAGIAVAFRRLRVVVDETCSGRVRRFTRLSIPRVAGGSPPGNRG